MKGKNFRKQQDRRLRRLRALTRDAAARREKAQQLLQEAWTMDATARRLRNEYNEADRAAAEVTVLRPHKERKRRIKSDPTRDQLLAELKKLMAKRECPVPATALS